MGILIRILLLVIVGALIYRTLKRFFLASQTSSGPGKQEESTKNTGQNKNRDPYQILGICQPITSKELNLAYRQKLSLYHPDKVDHLGGEIKELAKIKSQEITWAYQQLKGDV